MTSKLSITAAASSLALALAFAAPAAAQGAPQGAPQGAAPPQAQAAPAIGPEHLEAYANAKQEVMQINEKWSQQAAEAEDPNAIPEMRQQAEAEMVEAVRAEGLEVGEFNQIFELEQRDPAMRAEIEQYMN